MAMPDGSEQEAAQGREALRGVGVDPVPDDVVARLEARLDLELPDRPVPAAPVRRPRRRFGLLLGAPVAAAAAIVAVLVLGSSGTSPKAVNTLAGAAHLPAATTRDQQLQKAAAVGAAALPSARACPKGEVRRRARPGGPARCRPRHHAGAR
jgi:hypothetical protein